MCWIAGHAGPQREPSLLAEQLTTNALDGPDGTVFWSVLQEQGEVSVAKSARSVGFSKSDPDALGHEVGGGIDWIAVRESLDDLEQYDGHRTKMTTSCRNARFQGDVEERLAEQPGVGIGERFPWFVEVFDLVRVFRKQPFLGFLSLSSDRSQLIFDQQLYGRLLAQLLSQTEAGDTGSQGEKTSNGTEHRHIGRERDKTGRKTKSARDQPW